MGRGHIQPGVERCDHRFRLASFLQAAAAAAFIGLLGCSTQAAEPLSSWTWSGTISGGAVSGTASFSVTPDGGGWDLIIDVDNTASTAPITTAQVLTGLYFDVSPSTTALQMISAIATGGLVSTTPQSNADGGTMGRNICAPGSGGTAASSGCSATIGGGWEAAYGASGLANGVSQHWGIGTSGQSGVFNGNATTGVGSADYGILPSVGVTNQDGLSGMTPYTYATAEFVLTGLTTDTVTISNVEGTYGTLPEGTPAGTQVITSAPEPASLTLLLAGCIGLLGAQMGRWRARNPTH